MNAAEWLALDRPGRADVGLVGAPISRASISPSQAWSTPPAFRRALARFPTWDAEHDIDLEPMVAHDFGDVQDDRDDPDASAAPVRIDAAVSHASTRADVVVVIGGDNSLTRPVLQALMRGRPDRSWGLLTLDAHHDCRPADAGSSNGTPVRELIDSGLPGRRVAQVGIHPFGNRRDQAAWAHSQGVHIFGIGRVRSAGIAATLGDALTELRAEGVNAIHVDLDVDVVDRAFAPACPASLPGGMLPHQLLEAAHLLGRERDVLGADITEVDAEADVNGMTVRLAAAAFLSFCSGVRGRR